MDAAKAEILKKQDKAVETPVHEISTRAEETSTHLAGINFNERLALMAATLESLERVCL